MNSKPNADKLNRVVILPSRSLLSLNLALVWRYRGLVRMFVYRDFVTYYKQTVLGPLWFFIQPVFTALINLFVFGAVAGIGPEGVPGFLFYLSGPIVWQYFQDTFLKISSTFVDNQAIFGKVFFPRLVMPLTIIISGLLKFGVQFAMLLLAIFGYYFFTGDLVLNSGLWILPILLLILMIFTIGLGLIVTSVTTKYRDLKMFIDFAIPLGRYITPGIATTFAIYLNTLPGALAPLITYNPLGYVVDGFNAVMVGAGEINFLGLLYAAGIALVLLVIGMITFNQVEKNFMDTV